MKFIAAALAALTIAIPSSSANTQPGFIEKLTTAPLQFSQRWSNWIHKPKMGCDSKDIQTAINTDYAANGKPMTPANRYFGKLASYLADEHKCAAKAMEQELADMKNADKDALNKTLREIAVINDQLKSKKIDRNQAKALVEEREYLMALLPFGLDIGAQEYMTGMTARSADLRKGLIKYAKSALQRLESDQKTWATGAARSDAAIAAHDTDFVGRYFDSQLRQIAQDPSLFASLNEILRTEARRDYDIGRCLIDARFGDSRKTVSAYIDGALILGSVIPFTAWGIAITRGYRAAEAAAALVEKGGRLATASARLKQRYLVLAAEKAAAGKFYSRVGTAMLATGIAKAGRDCYASCYENILAGVVSSIEGQMDCKRITKLKGDFKDCAVRCARAAGRPIPFVRAVVPVVPDSTIKGAVESVQ